MNASNTGRTSRLPCVDASCAGPWLLWPWLAACATPSRVLGKRLSSNWAHGGHAAAQRSKPNPLLASLH